MSEQTRNPSETQHHADGIITIAGGAAKYVDQAIALLRSVRVHRPGLPVALVTDEAGLSVLPGGLFDEVILAKPEHGNPLRQKLCLDQLSPFARTLFIDSDCLVSGDPAPLFERLGNADSDDSVEPIGVTASWETDQAWYMQPEVWRDKLGVDSYPVLSSGCLAFRSGPEADRFFEVCRECYDELYEPWGVPMTHRFASDEPAVAGALVRMGYRGWAKDQALHCTTVTPGIHGCTLDILSGKAQWLRPEGGSVNALISHFINSYDSFEYLRERIRLQIWSHTKNKLIARTVGHLITHLIMKSKKVYRVLNRLSRLRLRDRA